MERVGQFPKHEAPVNRYPKTDLRGQLSFEDLARRIGQFKLSLYQPSEYVTDPKRLTELENTRSAQNFNQRDSERWLVGMMLTNFLKRLESSPKSLTLTLDRTITKINDLLSKIERFENSGQSFGSLTDDVLPDDDPDDEEFEVGGSQRPYRLSELDLARWCDDLRRDKTTLREAHEQVAAITPERDGKLQEISQEIRRKAKKPTTDRDGQSNSKLLVFTTFKDTAQYLYENLDDLAHELGLNIAMVSGDETRTTAGHKRLQLHPHQLRSGGPQSRNDG